ncbi:MAG: DNA polymerase II large subunit, partial [Methanosarcinaceae archaeon]|nr:DNA polymerase II large subunit [Methanosarcinaceae archaeon]
MEKLVSDAQTKSYFDALENGLNKEIAIANKARKNGKDPKPYSEIPIAKDLADRVENIIGVKVAEKIRSFEGKISREEASLIVGRDIAQDLSSTDGNAKAIEKGVRVAVAMLTEGVVAAPIEGIDCVDIAKNDDGTEYLKMFYAGPIRSAGGTAQALSILICDFIRRAFGIDKYKPRKDEVNRYIEEIGIYRRVANLQYMPSEDEIKLIVENCPICIDGEPTEEAEVEGYRNLERVDTNRVRGGMALVLAEGLALKAPKVQKHVKKLQIDGWEWLDQFLSHSKKDEEKDEPTEDEKTFQVNPSEKYLRDLIAGRPVFAHPSRPGGFRLRYGRSRNTSLAASGISPAGMIIMDSFISPGTQLKIERPGKAAGIVPVDSIEGPTVRLKSKSVVRIDDIDDAYKLKDEVEHIIDVGEILVNYGDFLENNHPLVTASYCFEWWIQDLLKSSKNCLSEYDEKELKDISQELALKLSETQNIPLHPKYTYLWHDITKNELKQLLEFIKENGTLESNNSLLKLPYNSFSIKFIKPILEKLLLLHTIQDDLILIESPLPLIKCLG